MNSDVCGPITPKTWDSKRYIVTFEDDYTGFVHTYLMAHKSEVVDYLKKFVAMAEAK